ncbi:Pumilio (PUM) protein [Klebsormidium nitens]|uniref:Pumilio (PUM) protein n=1 Tax=Klebsormidium nitens TaxID=105231 RepID=A0A1Y1HZE5_KLENI|nr:Pumilio (PUM) protein [Klebsormidium nitens]|eukprot:GAQ82559.1 Pumilio (PUM) protein [Klebsormidium nitens]
MGRDKSRENAGPRSEYSGRGQPEGGRSDFRGKGKGKGYEAGGCRGVNEEWDNSYNESYPVLGEGLKLNADLRQYFQEIAPLVGPNGTIKDPEELTILCNNGLEEAQGSEAALACDASCGRTLEALLTSAELPSLLSFLTGLCGDHFEAVARHHSGSHIIETALQALKQHGDVGAAGQALSAVCKAASATAVDLLCDRYGSHVLRRILSTLSGRDVQPGQSKHLGHGQRAPRGNNRGQRPVEAPFPALLAQFAEGIAAAAGPHVKQLRLDSSAGPGLQAILLALEGQEVPLERMVRAFLGCPEEVITTRPGEVLASADPDEVAELMRERSGSHLVEVIVKVSPPRLQSEFFDRFFRGSLKDLALHPSANFVLQAMFAAAHGADLVRAAAEELEEHFPQLLRENRGGVIAALVASCGRLGTYEKEVCRALARALTAQSSSPTRVVSDLLALDQHIASGNRWGKLPPLNCAILTTMFGFPKGSCQPFVDSVGSLTEAECVALASDPGGSRVVEAFLTGPTPDKQKRLFVGRLRGHFAELARDPSGSHCVEKCFTAADIKLKEAIVGELADGEAALLRTSHGPHVLFKASVSLYKSSPVSWRAHVSASEGARQMFADLFSERPIKNSPKGGAYGATEEAHELPEKEDEDRVDGGNEAGEDGRTTERKEKKRKRKRQVDGDVLEHEAKTALVVEDDGATERNEKKRKRKRHVDGEELGKREGLAMEGVGHRDEGANGEGLPAKKGKKAKRDEGAVSDEIAAKMHGEEPAEEEETTEFEQNKKKGRRERHGDEQSEMDAAVHEAEIVSKKRRIDKKSKRTAGAEAEPPSAEPDAEGEAGIVEYVGKKKLKKNLG